MPSSLLLAADEFRGPNQRNTLGTVGIMAMLCICIFTLSFSIGSYTGPSLMHIIRSLPVHSNPAVWMPRPSWAQPSVESSHLQPAIPLYSQTPGAAGAVGALPEQVATIVDTFAMVPDPKLKYQQLLFLAKALEKLPDEDHIQDNKVLGCTSQVCLRGLMFDFLGHNPPPPHIRARPPAQPNPTPHIRATVTVTKTVTARTALNGPK